jgi:HAD superfamily hydrolase (TIGR01509 family)
MPSIRKGETPSPRWFFMAPRISGILLDLGETLLSFGKVDLPSLFDEGSRLVYEHLRKLGHRLPPFYRYHRYKLLAIRWRYAIGRAVGREFDCLQLLRSMHSGLGIELSREQAVELAGMWYEPLGRVAVVEEGTADLLKSFRDQGLTLGVVSNTFVPAEVLDRHLQRAGLLDLLPVRVYSCRETWRKPDVRIFQAALERTHLAAAETLFVGDSVLADIRGANRAGLISVLKEPPGTWRLWRFGPRHRIARLEELRGIVRKYNGG